MFHFGESNYHIESRPGWVRVCPYCKQSILFTKIVGNSAFSPFFYSDSGNDVLVRESDAIRIQELLNAFPEDKITLEAKICELLMSAPCAPSGGRFTVWSNIKCPHCQREFPYANGSRDILFRLRDPYIVLVDGAVVVGDTLKQSWRVSIKAKSAS